MSKLSWGKPRIFALDKDSTDENEKWFEVPTPVEDSTELQSEKGDKMEAPIEGGELEDVKYKRNTYTVVYNVRKAKGRKKPYPSNDGLVDHHYSLMVMPEDPTCLGFYIESTTVGIDDTFTAADGAMWQIQHDAVKATTGNTVKWGTVSLSGSSLSFTGTDADTGTTVTGTLDNE